MSVRYQTQPEFILREIGQEAVLVPVGAVGELENSMISLNETYAFIWKQFQQPNTLDEAVVAAKAQYDGPEELIEQQVREATLELVKRSILKEV